MAVWNDVEVDSPCLTPVSLAAQEVENRKIMIQIRHGQILLKTLF
jgi:hypothetical protein